MFTKRVILALLIPAVGYFWLYYIKRGPVYNSDKSLEGKTVLITGGNAGVGKLTALDLAERGANVVLASRNLAKSIAVRDDIIKKSGNKKVKAMQLDLSDFDNVRDFAKEFSNLEKYLDYLINNAGANDIAGLLSSGVNKMFAVNHFGHFLLTNLLLDKMKAQSKSRPVRIINLSSEAYKWGSLYKEAFYENSTTAFQMLATYGHSKLANIYFTTGLLEKVKGYDITVYTVHPGNIATELGERYEQPLKAIREWIVNPIFLGDPFYGIQTTLYCALDDDVTKYSGRYFKNCQVQDLWTNAKNESLVKFLWEESVKITGLRE